MLGRAAQCWPEAPDAEAGQAGARAVHHARAFGHQALPLAGGTPGILFRQSRDGRHAAVAPLTTHPAQEGALEQLSIKPVCLGSPVLARDSNAGRVNDACLDATGAQPAGEPECA